VLAQISLLHAGLANIQARGKRHDDLRFFVQGDHGRVAGDQSRQRQRSAVTGAVNPRKLELLAYVLGIEPQDLGATQNIRASIVGCVLFGRIVGISYSERDLTSRLRLD